MEPREQPVERLQSHVHLKHTPGLATSTTTNTTRKLILSNSKRLFLGLCFFTCLSCVQSEDLTWADLGIRIQIPKKSEFDMDTVEVITFNYTSNASINISISSSDTDVAGIDGPTIFYLNSTTNDSVVSLSVNVSGTRFGRARLRFDINYDNGDDYISTICLDDKATATEPRCPELVVLRVTSLVDLIFQICLGCVLLLVTGMMGCKLKWEYIR
ncbi:uncharacterized protein LOC117100347, partial [Anneissia japonica]|uniref:uncharacterized protein LOC117100347 n=1 Tax=Anneissia japonica TaxID=1529436 RepID=UPI0014256092